MSSYKFDTQDIISTFVRYAKRARVDGLLSLEEEVKTAKNDFLKRGVQLVIDGADKEFTQNMMETELEKGTRFHFVLDLPQGSRL